MRTAKDVLTVEPALEAALDGVIAVSDQIDRRKVSNGAEAEELQGLRADYQALSAAAAEARSYLAKVAAAARTVKKFALLVPPDKAADCLGSTKIDENLGTFKAPDDFISKVIDKRKPRTDEGWLASGQAYGYGTTPIELAQRLSTTASTAASMEMALALSGKLQGDSGGALGGADYMRSMAQTAAFLERIPLVVGFSDRKPAAAAAANPPPPRQALPVVSPGPGGVAPAGQKQRPNRACRSSAGCSGRGPASTWASGASCSSSRSAASTSPPTSRSRAGGRRWSWTSRPPGSATGTRRTRS